mmetsp:Transcript_34452/g.83802  ORF Transcript_34452/g.83802 Transcript_34452/m.83802 type:complete len:237 (+) Transcript_34452:373-1083(+)
MLASRARQKMCGGHPRSTRQLHDYTVMSGRRDTSVNARLTPRGKAGTLARTGAGQLLTGPEFGDDVCEVEGDDDETVDTAHGSAASAIAASSVLMCSEPFMLTDFAASEVVDLVCWTRFAESLSLAATLGFEGTERGRKDEPSMTVFGETCGVGLIADSASRPDCGKWRSLKSKDDALDDKDGIDDAIKAPLPNAERFFSPCAPGNNGYEEPIRTPVEFIIWCEGNELSMGTVGME